MERVPHKDMLIHVEHLPGRENIQADWESCHISNSSDWRLNSEMFKLLEYQLSPFSNCISSTFRLLQLDARLNRMGSGCPVNPVVTAEFPHVPFICPHSTLPQQAGGRQDIRLVNCSDMDKPVVFSQLPKSLMDASALLPPMQDIPMDPMGAAHPLVLKGHPPLATWPASGDTFKQEALRKGLSGSLDSHGEVPQRLLSPVPGECGLAGAVEVVLIPF